MLKTHLKSKIKATCRKEETVVQDITWNAENLVNSIQTNVNQKPENVADLTRLARMKIPMANWKAVAW